MESKGEIISTDTCSFALLNQFDSNSLNGEPSNKALIYEIKYEAKAEVETFYLNQ